MSKVLVLTSQYTGIVGASGVCTRNIVEELKNRGNDVIVLCYENGVKEENVYAIPTGVKWRNKGKIHKIISALKSFFFPNSDKDVVKKFTDKAIEICSNNKIDLVLFIYFPLESIGVVKPIKELFPDIVTVIYELDSVGDGVFSSSIRNIVATKNYERWLTGVYNYADAVIIMKSHERYWMKTWGKKFSKKLLIADIPVLRERNFSKTQISNSVIMLYGGMLGKKYRSPQYLLLLLEKLATKKNIYMDFYSKGDCEDLINDFSKKNKFVRQHGYVGPKELNYAVCNADVLVSLGNKVSNSIPSKLISYFSYGKPVVHLSSKSDDICREYVNQYPLGLVLDECDSVEDNADKFYDFIEKTKNITESFANVSKSLLMNTPTFSVNLIEICLKIHK